jgi:probable rRNA maturation factor
MIEINNLTKEKIREEFLKKIAKTVLKGKKKGLSIALVKKGEIRSLNKKYRKKDKVTDVLSFSYGKEGEIILCPEKIKENAKRSGLSCEEELIRVLIHGILHFLGYDHEKSEKEARVMELKQEKYFSQIYNKNSF